MKKYVWLLIAAAFAVAVLAMVGCKPAETPSPSPSPTVTPTPVVGCPAVQRVVAYNVYDADGNYVNTKILVYLTTPIAFSLDDCLLDPNFWTIEVENRDRLENAEVTVDDVEPRLNGSLIEITAIVTEGEFEGLICSEDEAEAYAEAMDAETPESPDLVQVELDSSCILYNELGEECCDGLEGEACCTVICPEPAPSPVCPPM